MALFLWINWLARVVSFGAKPKTLSRSLPAHRSVKPLSTGSVPGELGRFAQCPSRPNLLQTSAAQALSLSEPFACPAPARRTFRPSGFAGGGSRAFSSLFPCSAPRQYHPAAVPGAGLGFSSQRQSQPPLQQRSEAPRRLRAVEPALGLFPTQPFYPYRSSGSGLCLDWIQPGDLLLRDLGYAVIEGWQALLKRGAYFVSRLRQDFVLWDAQTDQTLDLLRLLKSHSVLSLPLRLPPPLAAQRRR